VKNQTPFALCIIGGLLLILANYNYGVNTIVLLYLLLHGMPQLAALYVLIDIVLFVLFIIAWSGGVAVILGGYLLTTSLVRVGKIIIAVAAGFGLFSLILVVIGTYLLGGMTALLVLGWLISQSGWAIGLILTIVARSSAR
jgi:hypothetical protein